MKGIILHGGHGTRLRPLTHTGPKQLLPIANKPMSQYCVESLRDAGVIDIALIIGGISPNKVQEYYGTGEKFGVKIIKKKSYSLGNKRTDVVKPVLISIRKDFNLTKSDGVDDTFFYDENAFLDSEIKAYKRIIYRLSKT